MKIGQRFYNSIIYMNLIFMDLQGV